jgi:replicative superfamily II helicase
MVSSVLDYSCLGSFIGPISGLDRDEVAADPHLGTKRHRLITEAGRQLAKARMIDFDERNGKFTITDLGRIAARYYIRNTTIDIFNQEFRPRMTEADVLAMLSRSTEVCLRPLFYSIIKNCLFFSSIKSNFVSLRSRNLMKSWRPYLASLK